MSTITTPDGEIAGRRIIVPATIASGQSITGVISLGAKTLAGIYMPAGWTAANISFQVSPDGVTFSNLKDASAAEVSLAVAAGDFVRLNVIDWLGVGYLKIRSGVAAAAVNQAADRAFKLLALA